MAYDAKVLPVMIACPDDMGSERQAVRDVISTWNDIHSRPKNLVFLPVGWDTHLAPDLAGRPQEMINEGLLKHCDLLVGLFGSKLGKPTGKAESGSVEEIKEHHAAYKPAMVYFSSVLRENIDPAQLAALNEFKAWCKSNGIYRTFVNLGDLKQQFYNHLSQILDQNSYLRVQSQHSTPEPIPSIALEPASYLSNEAIELLSEAAADASSQVLKVNFMGDTFIKTNKNAFGKDVGPRAWARWELALKQLTDKGLLKHVKTTGEASTYTVTAKGYEVADRLRG